MVKQEKLTSATSVFHIVCGNFSTSEPTYFFIGCGNFSTSEPTYFFIGFGNFSASFHIGLLIGFGNFSTSFHIGLFVGFGNFSTSFHIGFSRRFSYFSPMWPNRCANPQPRSEPTEHHPFPPVQRSPSRPVAKEMPRLLDPVSLPSAYSTRRTCYATL